ncbi:hypothetical protein H0H92_011494 [Tricholoma furcatifolium]|nr:hypothetical protein H0H92_011494 [Tricholoma furcatifolium]
MAQLTAAGTRPFSPRFSSLTVVLPEDETFVPPAQVGGGPYNLRQVIKTTPNASPEVQKSAKQRLQLNPDVPEDAFLTGPTSLSPASGGPAEGDFLTEEDVFATGPSYDLDDDLANLDEDTLLSLASDAAYTPTPSPCITPSPKGTGPATMLSKASIPRSADPFLEGFAEVARKLNAMSSAAGKTADGLQDSSGTSEGVDSDLDKENNPSPPPSRPLPGRRPEWARQVLLKCFEDVDELISTASEATGLTPSAIRTEYMETHGTVYARSDWCKYEAYFAQNTDAERARVGNPHVSPSYCYKSFKALPGWREVLAAHEDWQTTGSQLIRERRRDFSKICGRFNKLLTEAHGRQFESVVAMVGSCVSEDAGLAYWKATPGLEELLSTRLDLTQEQFIGFAKSEAFHQKALAATLERRVRNASRVDSLKAEITSAASTGDSNPAEEATGGSVKGATAEALRNLCKAALFALYESAGHSLVKESKGKGKGKAAADSTDTSSYGRLPWNTLPQITAAEGLRMLSWPWGVDFPGQPGSKAQGGKAQGIKTLPTEAARLLFAALSGEGEAKPTLKEAEDADEVRDSAIPVMLTVAPPPGSTEEYGHVMFANGTVERCSKKFGAPRKDVAVKEAHEKAGKQPLPPLPPPAARVTRSKRKTQNSADSQPSHGSKATAQVSKPSKAPQKPKPAPSKTTVVVVSSDSDSDNSDANGAARSSLDLTTSLKAPPKRSVSSCPSNKDPLLGSNSSRASTTAPVQSWDASLPSNKPHRVRSNSRASSTAPAPPARANSRASSTANPRPSSSSKPAEKEAPAGPLASLTPTWAKLHGQSLNAREEDFEALDPARLGFAFLPLPKRSGDSEVPQTSSPPKKPRLSPIPERPLPHAGTAVLPQGAYAAPSAAPPVALPAAPPAAAPSVTPAGSTLPIVHPGTNVPTSFHPYPNPLPEQSFANPASSSHMGSIPREQGFYMPPGMMVDPSYFASAGGFVRFGGDMTAADGRPGSFGYQMPSGLFSPVPGAFGVPPQSMGGFAAFSGSGQPQGPPAYVFPGNYPPRVPMQGAAGPSAHAAQPVAPQTGAQGLEPEPRK